MNIFALHLYHDITAPWLVDQHVHKMAVEGAQLLSVAHALHSPEAHADRVLKKQCYRASHSNHPCAKWVRQSRSNYVWLCGHVRALLGEFEYRRFNAGNEDHATFQQLRWLEANPIGPPDTGLTPFVQAMPDDLHTHNPILSYRIFYLLGKAHLHRWKRRDPPPWIADEIRRQRLIEDWREARLKWEER